MQIGVFDSGLGGLTVVRSMTKWIKGAKIFYVADTKNAPYGEKTREQILQYSLDIAQYLIDTHQIDALIVACNTATSVAIEQLRTHYPSLIIIGTEPGIKPAFELTLSGKVGVLATPATLKGSKYQELANALSSKQDVELFEQACPGLVEQIEKGEIDSPQTEMMLETWLSPMRDNNVDTIVLGCTHYPLVAQVIKKVMQKNVNLIETGDAIAKRLLALSQGKGCFTDKDLQIYLYVTGKINRMMIDTIIDAYGCIEEIDLNRNSGSDVDLRQNLL